MPTGAQLEHLLQDTVPGQFEDVDVDQNNNETPTNEENEEDIDQIGGNLPKRRKENGHQQ